MDFIQDVTDQRLLAIIRGSDPDASVATALTLVEQGVRLLEISMTSTDALTVVREVAGAVGPDVQVGAGTVLTEAQVDDVLAAGATFLVTPALAPSVDRAVAQGVPVACGALTPTEVVTALDRGADVVKIFPAHVMGPTYLADLRAPFPHVPFVPVGGIGADDVQRWLDAGAVAVGVGSPLCGDAPRGGDLGALRERATAFLEQARR